jgi:Flp pilus assembly CpaF family ATPase
MTTLSGERLDDEPSPVNSVLERPDAIGDDVRREPRALDEIFPLSGDATRARQMQETWRAFADEMKDAVQAALDASRSPPEIAYAIGEIVHNYFRTRGVILTSYELRRLVAELLALRQGVPDGEAQSLVTFTQEPTTATSWTGDEPGTPGPVVPDVVFQGPPSRLVDVAPRDRDAATRAGPLDRLWADRSIRAVFVNGPAAIYVDRSGVLEPSSEKFRDQAQLDDLVGRLVARPPSGAATFRLRDGGEGLAIFPPAAPAGPVLVLRRGEPGNATFERLIAAGMLDRSMADLLRIAARCRLNMLVVGAAGLGKTALLAALARDLSGARVVTLARHRTFCWPSPSKVELVVPPDASFDSLLAAGVALQPALLIVDSVRRDDVPALAGLLSRGHRGIVAAAEPPADAPRHAVDLLICLGGAGGWGRVTSMEDANGGQLFVHDEGRFQRRTAAPSFAGGVHQAGYGEALASTLGC